MSKQTGVLFFRTKWSLAFLLLCLVCVPAMAQKLPNVQKGGFRAPANVKIDGKTSEWGDTFKAYNTNIEVFYTIANDDDNLYLVIQATNADVINKMARGGITFTINHGTGKNDANPVSIYFPALNDKDKVVIGQSVSKKPTETHEAAIIQKQTDSLAAITNKLFATRSKLIKIKGIKAITDTIISIYNEQDIEERAYVNAKRACTFELSVPLKYLPVDLANPKPFAYNITINGANVGGGAIVISQITGMTVAFRTGDASQLLRYSTDFWGEYTFAKKQ
jgi:hypothetical protein